MLPKISIVTAVLNADKHLENAINSLIQQEYPSLEYIVIDGGSDDSTLEIIEKYKDHIDYFVSEPDEGNADAQNKGAKAATGEIIGYLAADDTLEPGTLDKVGHMFLSHPDAQMVTCGAQILREQEQGGLSTEKIFQGKCLDLNFSAILACPITNARFIKKEVMEEHGYQKNRDNRGEYFLANDKEFLLRLAINGVKNYSFNDIGYTYVSHENSLTFSGNVSRTIKMHWQHLDIYEDFLALPNLTDEDRSLLKKYHRKYSLRLVANAIREGNLNMFSEALKRGIQMNHIIWLAYLTILPGKMIMKRLKH